MPGEHFYPPGFEGLADFEGLTDGAVANTICNTRATLRLNFTNVAVDSVERGLRVLADLIRLHRVSAESAG